MGENIKDKSIKGLFWNGLEKFSLEIIQFVIGIVLARLLMPSDYGVIGIMMVFISFSIIFIDGGLTKALIQKIDRTEDDFNTAFIYNLLSSLIIYLLLFIAAPYIANWYSKPELTWLLRVLTLNLIVSAFASIQNTRFTIAVDFKRLSVVSVSASIFSGLLGIFFAYNGFGVWALAIQQLSNTICKTIVLNVISKWFPKFRFSITSFKELFGFGYKLILTNILARIYSNLYPLIIGKLYPFTTLGFYTRGQHYAALPMSIMKSMFLNVSFPVLSTIKQDDERLRKSYSRFIEMSSFVIFPLMFIVIVISEPLIKLMLTDKWIESVPFMQILCFGYMFDHINAINLNLLFVKGRSDLALKLEVFKKTIAISILVFSTFWGIWGICIGQAFYNFLATFINSIYTKKLINLSYLDQARDFMKIWVVGAVTASLAFFIMQGVSNCYLKIGIAILCYICIYIMVNMLFQVQALKYSVEIVKEYYNKFKLKI